jgi:predicted ATPase
VAFRRLAVFVGPFSIDAALAVATDETFDAEQVFAAIDSLVDKSMVMSLPMGAMMRYRLLDAARAYALHISADPVERAALAARHATYCRRWLEQFAADAGSLLDPMRRASHLAGLINVRAALAWCFGGEGDAELGLDLAAAAAPVFFAMSLLTECQTWSRRAIATLGTASLGGLLEMRLQAALGLSLMWTRGNSDATYVALNRSMAIAAEQGDALTQILLLTPLHVFHMRLGDFKKAMLFAEQVAELARTSADAQAIALSRILLGFSHHFVGELDQARRELEAALQQDTGEAAPSVTMKDDPIAAPILVLASSAAADALARTLWLQGHPAAALRYVNQTFENTASAQHPVTLLVALIYAISVLIWNGDHDDADRQIVRFIANAESYALKSHVMLGHCFEGQLAISRGDTERGIELLQTWLHDLRAQRYELLTTSFNISLAEAIAATGRLTEGISLIDTTIRSVETNGDFCYMPELLRVKANLLLELPQPREDLADVCLAESLALSRRQGALAWELRTSIDTARRFAARGAPEQSRALLQPVVDQFAAESRTADLRIAQTLLATWR